MSSSPLKRPCIWTTHLPGYSLVVTFLPAISRDGWLHLIRAWASPPIYPPSVQYLLPLISKYYIITSLKAKQTQFFWICSRHEYSLIAIQFRVSLNKCSMFLSCMWTEYFSVEKCRQYLSLLLYHVSDEMREKCTYTWQMSYRMKDQ